MKQQQADLKQNFHDWLVTQGFCTKTKTGRVGSVYEYIRHIDRICDIIQSKHDNGSWNWLAQHIYPVLGFFVLCRKGSVKINATNQNCAKEFLTSFLNSMSTSDRNAQSYFMVQTQYSDGEILDEYATIREFILPGLSNDITLKLNIPKAIADSERKALKKFYKFLCDWLTLQKAEQYGLNYSKIIETKNQIDNLKQRPTKPMFELKVRGGTNKRPPQLEPVNSKCRVQRIRELMGITRGAKLPIEPDKDGMYSPIDANKHMQDHFCESDKAEGPEVKEWWDTKTVLTKIRWTKDKWKYHKNKVARVEVSKKKTIYYPPDVMKEARKKFTIL